MSFNFGNKSNNNCPTFSFGNLNTASTTSTTTTTTTTNEDLKNEILELKNEIKEIKNEIQEVKNNVNEISEMKNNVNDIKSMLQNFISNSEKDDGLALKESSSTIDVKVIKTTQNDDKTNINNNNNDNNVNSNHAINNNAINNKVNIGSNNKNPPIEIIDEQEPIYDQRIKYIAEGLNITFENEIKRGINNLSEYRKQIYNEDTRKEYLEKFPKLTKDLYEVYKYMIYLKVEQIDLNNVIKMAYNKYNYNPKIINIFTERLTEVSNKINQINEKYREIANNENTYQIKTGLNYNIYQLLNIIKSIISNCNGQIITNYANKILKHLNRVRLINICPSATCLYKKGNTINNITVFNIANSIQQPTEDLLMERYKNDLYNNEYLFNNLSFHLNKASFYNDSYKILI